jgi:hypothetical protein
MVDIKKISVALSPEILKQLEDGNYNKSRLIDSLLTEHFNKQKIINKIRTSTTFYIFPDIYKYKQ